MHEAAHKTKMEALDPLVGEWEIEAFAGAGGRSAFEWTLDGAFLLQRTEVEHPDAPDSTSIVTLDATGEAYTQHYFDSRGVARIYSMTFAGGAWTLLRESPDFSPLDFRQRYRGQLSDDGKTIAGTWEIAHGESFEKDFDLTYRRIG